MGAVRSNTSIFLDDSIEYGLSLSLSRVGHMDIISLGDFALHFHPGALRKLQAAIDVYLGELGGAHTQAREDWQAEAADAEAK